MSGLISGLAGAGGAANNVGNYYTSAANQFGGVQAPMTKEIAQEYLASLRPAFASNLDQASAQAAATGLAGSGEGTQYLTNAVTSQAANEAQGLGPIYQSALQDYAGIISQMPGAQASAYNDAINNFYQGIGSAASLFGGGMIPNLGGGSPDTSMLPSEYPAPPPTNYSGYYGGGLPSGYGS